MVFVSAAAACLCAIGPDLALAASVSTANGTVFGPNVYVFDSSMPAADIQSIATAIYKKMESNQFGSERYALLFKPGKYDVTFNVGFYTHVAGLGRNPDDVNINGGVTVNAKWMDDCQRDLQFLADAGKLRRHPVGHQGRHAHRRLPGRAAAAAARQGDAAPVRLRRSLEAGWASGGFLADSVVDGKVLPASQQQWLSRNSKWGKWTNGVWNMVFVGCVNAPSGAFPNPPYTVVNQTPVIREKPYLYVDSDGKYSRLRSGAAEATAQGVSWAAGPTPGKSVSIDQFYIAQPSTATAASINAALAAGKHILFTPGNLLA